MPSGERLGIDLRELLDKPGAAHRLHHRRPGRHVQMHEPLHVGTRVGDLDRDDLALAHAGAP
jgi:hypothetical protein